MTHEHGHACTLEVCGVGPSRAELIAQSNAQWDARHPGEQAAKKPKAAPAPKAEPYRPGDLG